MTDLRKIFTIIIVSFSLGMLYNILSPKGLDLIREKMEFKQGIPQIIEQIDEPVNLGGGTKMLPQMISIEDAFSQFKLKSALFIDARDRWEFAEGHIKGAINIPEYNFEEDNQITASLIKNRTYIIYCGDSDCDLSKRLALKLKDLGFEKLFVIEFGWEIWKESKFPTEK